MYPDLYKGLRLRPEDLTYYDSPLVGSDRKTVILKGQIRLPVQAGSKIVKVDFIVVDEYSPYTAIIARPWPHAMGAVSSTLHLKVKYPLGDQVEELIRSQSIARQFWWLQLDINLKVNHWSLQRQTYSNQGEQSHPRMQW